MSAGLAEALGADFENYSLYFPPIERAWATLAISLSDVSGLSPDLVIVLMTGVTILFSCGFAYHIRRASVGASPLFLVGSIAILTVIPVLYKDVFGLREHLVMLGLWPYLVLRISDPEKEHIGWKTRAILGLWLGTTLLFKYLYALVVVLVELAAAVDRRKLVQFFQIENLVSGSVVAVYLLIWLVLDPSQREAIATIVSAIDANLTSTRINIEQAAIRSSLSVFFLLIAFVFKIPPRVSLIGLALVVAAVIAAWIQARWYTHHVFLITMAYLAWLWMIRPHVKLLWQLALLLLIARPVIIEFRSTAPYLNSVAEVSQAMESAGISVHGKRVGLLTMHPSPFSQYLASNGALRWNPNVNMAYVASELHPDDLPENAGKLAPPSRMDDPGRAILHNQLLSLWEDLPPDVLILDRSTSWPLRHIKVDWTKVFAEDERFNAILAQYEPVLEHDGKMLEYTYYTRKN